MGGVAMARVVSIEVVRKEQAGFDMKCLDTLLDDFECLQRLDLTFDIPDTTSQVEVQESLSIMGSRGVQTYVNGALCSTGNRGIVSSVKSRPKVETETQSEGYCIRIKRQIGTRIFREGIQESLLI